MSYEENARSLQEATSAEEILQIATGIRERIEVVHTAEFSNFLKHYFPCFKSILNQKIPPQMLQTPGNKARHTILEILNRLPNSELLWPYVPQLLQVSMEVLQHDNEDNGIVAIRIIFDLHKNYRPNLESEVQPFLELVQTIYRNLRSAADRIFSAPPENEGLLSGKTSPTGNAASGISKGLVNSRQTSTSGFSSISMMPDVSQTESMDVSEKQEHLCLKSEFGDERKHQPSQPQLKALESFKVLGECPLIVMLMFQLYAKFIQQNVPQLIPLMMETLNLQAPESAHRNHRARYRDFIQCQVKTLSFLTYLLRAFTSMMQPHEESLTKAVVKMLTACPSDAISSRKELLVTTRHILATEFRKGFFHQLDALLDEKVLIGAGYTTHETLRPLAYSLLADLVHHVRSKLTMPQLTRVIHIFTRNIHDATLPLSMQSTSVKLLLNLVDYIFHNHEKEARTGKLLFIRILQALVNKFKTLQTLIPQIDFMERNNVRKSTPESAEGEQTDRSEQKSDRGLDLLESLKQPVASKETKIPPAFLKKNLSHWLEAEIELRQSCLAGPAALTDTMKDMHSLIKTMVYGLKTVIWCVCNYRRESLPSHQPTRDLMTSLAVNEPYIMSTEEKELVSHFFEWGLPCCSIYLTAMEGNVSHATTEAKKEILEHFSGAFTVLESFNLRNIVSPHLPLLMENLIEHQALLSIPQLFLSNQTSSYTFCEIFTSFLVSHLERLGQAHRDKYRFGRSPNDVVTDDDMQMEKNRENDAVYATMLLRLFKIIFGSMSLFPDNEAVLRPHLQPLIILSLRYAASSENPVNYYFLLRALFRAVSGGKFEASYKEIAPVLTPLLSSIYRLHERTEEPSVRNILVELSLSLPSRLSAMLPHLPVLTRLLVHALRSKGELAALGLRSLEFWIDNLNPDFVSMLLEQDQKVSTRIMCALCDHLKPAPYPYGMLALRLLGKMGGRNRRFLKETIQQPTPAMNGLDAPRHPLLQFEFEWINEAPAIPQSGGLEPSKTSSTTPGVVIPLDRCLDRACTLLERFVSRSLSEQATNKVTKDKEKERKPVSDTASDTSSGLIPGAPCNAPDSVVAADRDLTALESPRRLLKSTLDQAKRQCYELLFSCFCILIEAEALSPEGPYANKQIELSDLELLEKPAESFAGLPLPQSITGADKLNHRRFMAGRIFKSLLTCAADPDLEEEVKPVVEGLVLHVARLTTPNSSLIPDVKNTISKIIKEDGACTSPETGRHSCALEAIFPNLYAVEKFRPVMVRALDRLLRLNQCSISLEFPLAVVEAMSDPRNALNNIGLWILHLVIDGLKLAPVEENDKDKAAECKYYGMYLVHTLFTQLCEACYEKRWRTKMGGCRGIKELTRYVQYDILILYEMKIVAALFFILKDHPRELAETTLEEVQSTLSLYFSKAYGTALSTNELPQNGGKESSEPSTEGNTHVSCTEENTETKAGTSEGIQDIHEGFLEAARARTLPRPLLELFAGMVTSPSQSARSVCKSLVLALAKSRKTSETELLMPIRAQIKSVVYAKAIRLLQPPQQVGVLEGLAYCFLATGPPLIVQDTEEANRFMDLLSEVLKLSEQDVSRQTNILQEVLSQRKKAGGKELLAVADLHGSIQLRISAIRMMHALVANPSPAITSHSAFNETRHRIVNLLFKCVTSQHSHIVDAAQGALRHVVENSHNLKDPAFSNEELMNFMRPILFSCSEYRKLTLPLLQGLSRLMYLLNTPFNVPFGDKLIKHLESWKDPTALQASGFWPVGEEPQVAAEIIGLFHLLPSSGVLMGKVIDMVVRLERILPLYKGHTESSKIFRKPLAKYLNKYPEDACDYFLRADTLLDQSRSDFFLGVLPLEECCEFRATLAELSSLERLTSVTLSKSLAAAKESLAPPSSPDKSSLNPVASAALLQVAEDEKKAALLAKQHALEAANRAAKAHEQAQVAYQRTQQIQQQVTMAQVSGQVPEQLSLSHQSALKIAQQASQTAQDTSKIAAQAKMLAEKQERVAAEAMEAATATPGSATSARGFLGNDDLELQVIGLQVCQILVMDDPALLLKNTKLFENIRTLWRSQGRVHRLQAEEGLSPRLQQESQLLLVLLVAYFRSEHDESRVDLLFEMLSIFQQHTCVDLSFLREFYHHEVAKIMPADQRRKVFSKFLIVLQDKKISQELKTRTLQFLIIPMLFATLQNDEEKRNSIDSVSLQSFVQDALSPTLSVSYSENLRVELLKLSTLLIEHLSEELVDHRKELVRFSWSQLKFEDSIVKYWAYINISRFIAIYEMPSKVTLQVYVALLKTTAPEAKELVTVALDILVPILPKKLNAGEFVKVIKYTKRIMYEDGHALSQLVHMWQLLVGQALLFYPFRSQFVPLMVNSLNRLALPPNCPHENRQLAFSLAKLILGWEKLRLERLKAEQEGAEDRAMGFGMKRPADEEDQDSLEENPKKSRLDYSLPQTPESMKEALDSESLKEHDPTLLCSPLPGFSSQAPPTPGPSLPSGSPLLTPTTPPVDDEFTLNAQMKDMVVNFLVRVAMVLANSKDPEGNELSQKCVELLSVALDLWPMSSIKFNIFEKFIESSNDPSKGQSMSPGVLGRSGGPQKTSPNPEVLRCAIEVMHVSLRSSACNESSSLVNPFIVDNLPRVMQLIRPCFDEEDSKLREKACSLIQRIFDIYPPRLENTPNIFASSGFYSMTRDLFEKRLSVACTDLKDPTSAKAQTVSAYAEVRVIEHMSLQLLTMAEVHATSLSKLAQHLTRQHMQVVRAKLAEAASTSTVLHKLLPTPLIAIVHEALLPEPPKPEPLSEQLHCLIITLRLLSRLIESAQTNPKLAELRKPLFQVFGVVLEQSESIPLLMVVTRILGDWLVSPNSPLGQPEKGAFLTRLVGLDRLNEVLGQPVQMMVADILLKLHASLVPSYQEPLPVRKIFTLGLVVADENQRAQFLEHFIAGVGSSPLTRLQHIFQSNWEYLKNRYWLVVATEVILSALCPESPIKVHAATVTKIDNPFQPQTSQNERYQIFLDMIQPSQSQRQCGPHLLAPLYKLGYCDLALGAMLWEKAFTAAWSSLNLSNQSALIPTIVQLLARTDHKMALYVPTYLGHGLPLNVIQSLLSCMLQLRPIPLIPVDLLAILALNYNCWYLVVPLVEHLVVTCLAQERATHVRMLGLLYRQLNEMDLYFGLCRRISAVKDTKVALSLEAYGYVKEAQQIYHSTISRENSGVSSVAVSQLELELWEERWIDCAETLGQWTVLKEFSHSLQQPELMLRAAWKNKEWDLVRQLLATSALQPLQESGSPIFKLYETYLNITDGKVGSEAERNCAQCVQLALAQWQQLPTVHTASQAHRPLFHLFQQIVEVRESSQIMIEVQNPSRNRGSFPDFKNVLATWRERLPNKWENIKDWDNLLAWRQQIFSLIANTFRTADHSALACLQDTPWTVVKLAHIARKQRLLEVCLQYLSKLYSISTMDVQDAFEKLREQIVICHNSPSEHRGGLNIINNTNLDYFTSNQKAELFRLKGMFLGSLGAVQDANHAYSHAMQICGSYGKGWYSWAKYCDSIFSDQKKVHYAVQALACYLQAVLHGYEGARLSLGRVLWMLSMDDEKQTLARTVEKHGPNLPEWVWLLWLPQLLTALGRPEALAVKALIKAISVKYPQAVYYTLRAFLLERRELPNEPSRKGAHSAAASADEEEQSLSGSRTLGKATTGPATTHLPTTSNSATKTEPACTISSPHLTGETGSTPVQPALNPIKLESDLSGPSVSGSTGATANTEPSTGSNAPPAPAIQTAATHAEEIMAIIRRGYPLLGLEMEMVLEELIVHFRPSSAEELLLAVHTLLIKCFQLVNMSLEEPIPTTLGATLIRITKKFFHTQSTKTEQQRAFVDLYQEQFQKDFDFEASSSSSGTYPPLSLQTVVHRLKKWKYILQANILRATLQKSPMHEYSMYLAQVHYEPPTWNPSSRVFIEVPGIYNNCFKEPRTDLHPKIVQFQSHVGIQHRYGGSLRLIGMFANDGHLYKFQLQFAMAHITRTDERVMQMHQVMKQILEKGKQSARRLIDLSVSVVVPVTPRMRLVEDREDYISLGEVYDLDRMSKNLDPDHPILLCRERISNAINSARLSGGDLAAKQAEREMKTIVFKEVCEKHVQSDILARYLHGYLGDAESIWAFQKAFAIQLAVSSLSCYLLACGERVPHRLVFGRKTARVVMAEFRPGYNHMGLLESSEEVKFRLTRNLSTMLSRFLIDGVFAITMSAVSLSLSKKSEVLRPFFSLMIRDDILSWHSSKSPPRSEIEQRVIEQQLSDRVEKNVQKILEKVCALSPVPGELDPTSKIPIPIDGRVQDLIEAAENSGNLSQMNPTWMPWL